MENRIDARRRRLLASLGVGGVAGLAGCGGGDDGDSTATPTEDFGTPPGMGTDTPGQETDTPSDGTATATDEETATPTEAQEVPDFVDGATFNMWMGVPDVPLNEWQYDKLQIRDEVGPGIPRYIYPLVIDYRAEVDLVTGEIKPFIVQDWEYTANKITFTIRENARWSDGAEILGADIGMAWELGQLRSRTPQGVIDEFGEIRGVGEGVTDVTWDGKTVSLHSEPGHFGKFYARSWLLDELTSAGSKEFNEDRAIYEPILQEIRDMGKTRPGQANNEQANTRVDEYFSNHTENVDYKEQRYSGPWVINDVTQQYVSLAPNEEHRNPPNWSEVRITPIENQQQRWTAMQSNNIDGVPGLGEAPPAQVIRGLPDNWDYHLYSQGARADGLLTQGQLPLLGDREFKAGIMRSIDKKRLARINHEYASQPLKAPMGLHFTGAQQVVPDDVWDGYQHYDFDTDRATQHFQNLGMTKEGGSWLRPDGSDLTIKYLTDAQTFQYEQTVASMLQDVGIDVQITRIDSATYSNRIDAGDFQMINNGWWAAHAPAFYNRALQQAHRRKRFGVFNEEKVQNWIEEHDNIVNVDYDWTHNIEGFTPEQAKHFTVSAPPVGQPDAEPSEEYPVVYYIMRLGRSIPADERERLITELAWVWNYTIPVMQMHTTYNIAFQDHEQYLAPEDDRGWAWPEPTHPLMMRGEIKALAAAAEEQ